MFILCINCNSYDIWAHIKCDKCDKCLPFMEDASKQLYFHCEHCDLHQYGTGHVKCLFPGCKECLSEDESHCDRCGHVKDIHTKCDICGVCLRSYEYHCELGCGHVITDKHFHCENCGERDDDHTHTKCEHCDKCLKKDHKHCLDCNEHIFLIKLGNDIHKKCETCGKCITGSSYKIISTKCCLRCGEHDWCEHSECTKEGCTKCLSKYDNHCDICGEHTDTKHEKCPIEGCNKCLIIRFDDNRPEERSITIHCVKCNKHFDVYFSKSYSNGFHTKYECFSAILFLSKQLEKMHYLRYKEMDENLF